MKKILFLLLLSIAGYGQTSTGQEQEFDYGIKNNSLQTITTPTYIGTFGTDGTQGKIPSAYIAKTASVQDSLNKKINIPTGFLQGLQLSINADPTKFNIAAGYYVVTDFTNLTQPVVKIINYAGATGLTPAYLATANSTYVALDKNQNVISSASPFTDAQRRTLAIIGNVVHSNHTTINVVNEIKAPIVAIGNQLHDFMKAIGFLNESGNVYSAKSGINLQINKSVGAIFGMGINASDYLSPHKLTIPSQTALTFAYRFQNGTQLADTKNINPNIYDVGGISTATPSNKWTIQRINLFQSGLSRIQPGQTVYNSFNDAVVALPTQPFVTEQNIADNAVFRCYLIIQQGTTNLASAVAGGSAQFVPVDKFGNIIGNGSVALTYSNIVAALGYTPENVANKSDSYTASSSTTYASTKALVDGLATKQNTLTNPITGTGTANTISKWTGTSTQGNSSITDNGSAVAIGIPTTIKGTTATDGGKLGSELLTTGTSDASWTGTSFATGYTHVAGSVTTLTSTLAATINNFYQITYTVTGRTTGSFTIGFGGYLSGGITATGNIGPRATTTETLVITPTTDFNGTIVLSIKQITPGSATVSFLNSSGAVSNEIRAIGNSNTANGVSALSSNTTGNYNTANGASALSSNTTGGSNTANGVSALSSNTTGNSNTANGESALLSNTTGNYNTANGVSALRSNTTGGSNTANGVSAGRFISNKSTAATILNNSIFLGYRTSPLADNQTNQVVIGYDATGLGSNSTVIGNSSTSQTWLGGRLTIGSTVDDGTNAFQLTGSAKLTTTPVTSAGTYDILTRNSSTGVVEKKLNADFVHTSGDEIIDGQKSFQLAPLIRDTFYPSLYGSIKLNKDSFKFYNGDDLNLFNVAVNSFNFINTSGFSAVIQNNALTASRTYTLPDTSGTVALVETIKPYKVYTALLSQSGTSAPVATVLENTLGGTIVWTRSNIGQYVGTLTGAFTDQKTIIFVNRSNPAATAFDTNMAANVININTVGYTTFSNSAYVDGQTNSASIEIRVYN